MISDRAHLILPHHRALEALAEEARGAAARSAPRCAASAPPTRTRPAGAACAWATCCGPATLPAKLEEARRHYEQVCRGAGRAPDGRLGRAGRATSSAFGERLRPRITDVSLVLHRQMAQGYSVLFEGAQATLLDLDHGTYPFVTSSSATAGGVAHRARRRRPRASTACIGIAKAYTTRVGAGPLPSEIGGALEDEIRERGHEFGATTGRPRRCGWFDAVVVRYSVRVNGFDTLALTKLDVLDELAEIQVCTALPLRGRDARRSSRPTSSVLEACEPVYETLPGWQDVDRGRARLRDAARRRARATSSGCPSWCGVEIGIVSTGPDREQTILRAKSAVASWFE